MEKRSILRPKVLDTLPIHLPDPNPEFLFDAKATRKIQMEYELSETRKVYNSYLDLLGHVNNCRYSEFAYDTFTAEEKARLAEEQRQREEAIANAQKLKGCTVKLTAKAGNGGRLFGAVTTKEIAEGLKAQYGMDIPKQKLVLDEPIKAFGTYEVKAKLGFEVSGVVKVTVTEA